MSKGIFFYNYKADKANSYSKFCYGIITIECDENKILSAEAFDEIQKESKKQYPDADNIEFTAFNPV